MTINNNPIRYQNRDNRTSNMRHRNRTTMDKKSYNDKRGVRDRSQVRLNHTSTQCPSPTHSLRLLVDASVQTSSFQPASTPSLSSEHEKLFYFYVVLVFNCNFLSLETWVQISKNFENCLLVEYLFKSQKNIFMCC